MQLTLKTSYFVYLVLALAGVALFILAWPAGLLVAPLLLLAAFCGLLLEDVEDLYWWIRKWRIGIDDPDPYLKYEPKPKGPLALSGVAVALFVVVWLLGGFVTPGASPTKFRLVVDLGLTAIGLMLSVRAKQTATGWQNIVAWIPVFMWLLHIGWLIAAGQPVIIVGPD